MPLFKVLVKTANAAGPDCGERLDRRDFITFSALAGLAVALPAHADAERVRPMRLLILGGTGSNS